MVSHTSGDLEAELVPNCTLFLDLQFAMVYRLVQRRLHFIMLKMDDSLPAVLKYIKQQALPEILTQKSYLHWNSLVLTVFFLM